MNNRNINPDRGNSLSQELLSNSEISEQSTTADDSAQWMTLKDSTGRCVVALNADRHKNCLAPTIVSGTLSLGLLALGIYLFTLDGERIPGMRQQYDDLVNQYNHIPQNGTLCADQASIEYDIQGYRVAKPCNTLWTLTSMGSQHLLTEACFILLNEACDAFHKRGISGTVGGAAFSIVIGVAFMIMTLFILKRNYSKRDDHLIATNPEFLATAQKLKIETKNQSYHQLRKDFSRHFLILSNPAQAVSESRISIVEDDAGEKRMGPGLG